jgi:hypothetical protein
MRPNREKRHAREMKTDGNHHDPERHTEKAVGEI